MKIIFILFFSFFFTHSISAQSNFLKVTNPSSKKEAIFKENKRIWLLTKEGYQISGTFTIESKETLSIKGRSIKLIDILELKRNPKLTSILTSAGFIYSGALLTGFSVIAGIFVQPSAYLLAIPGAGLIYTGIKSPNFHKNYKRAKGWEIEIIQESENKKGL